MEGVGKQDDSVSVVEGKHCRDPKAGIFIIYRLLII